MKNNKYQVMELFLYVLIVLVGLIFLFIGKSEKVSAQPSTTIAISEQTKIQCEERAKTNAVIFDRKG
jgi:hypothetical protein